MQKRQSTETNRHFALHSHLVFPMAFSCLPNEILVHLLCILTPYALRQLSCTCRKLYILAGREMIKRYERIRSASKDRKLHLTLEETDIANIRSKNWAIFVRSFWQYIQNQCYQCERTFCYAIPHPLEPYALCSACKDQLIQRRILISVGEIASVYHLTEDDLLCDLPSGWIRSCDLEESHTTSNASSLLDLEDITLRDHESTESSDHSSDNEYIYTGSYSPENSKFFTRPASDRTTLARRTSYSRRKLTNISDEKKQYHTKDDWVLVYYRTDLEKRASRIYGTYDPEKLAKRSPLALAKRRERYKNMRQNEHNQFCNLVLQSWKQLPISSKDNQVLTHLQSCMGIEHEDNREFINQLRQLIISVCRTELVYSRWTRPHPMGWASNHRIAFVQPRYVNSDCRVRCDTNDVSMVGTHEETGLQAALRIWTTIFSGELGQRAFQWFCELVVQRLHKHATTSVSKSRRHTKYRLQLDGKTLAKMAWQDTNLRSNLFTLFIEHHAIMHVHSVDPLMEYVIENELDALLSDWLDGYVRNLTKCIQ
jgi:hypothetical protein